MRISRALAVTVALFLGAVSAYGHNFHTVLSTISLNERTGNLEIVQELTLHDLMPVLIALSGDQALTIDSEGAEIMVRDYLNRNFRLRFGKTDAAIEWIGMEADIDTLTTYQQVTWPGEREPITVENRVLADAYSDQVNTLTLVVGDAAKSYSFIKGQFEQEIAVADVSQDRRP
ncbi:MAG: DUF6702 family protein [Pseudomonadota bacterium]